MLLHPRYVPLVYIALKTESSRRGFSCRDRSPDFHRVIPMQSAKHPSITDRSVIKTSNGGKHGRYPSFSNCPTPCVRQSCALETQTIKTHAIHDLTRSNAMKFDRPLSHRRAFSPTENTDARRSWLCISGWFLLDRSVINGPWRALFLTASKKRQEQRLGQDIRSGPREYVRYRLATILASFAPLCEFFRGKLLSLGLLHRVFSCPM